MLSSISTDEADRSSGRIVRSTSRFVVGYREFECFRRDFLVFFFRAMTTYDELVLRRRPCTRKPNKNSRGAQKRNCKKRVVTLIGGVKNRRIRVCPGSTATHGRGREGCSELSPSKTRYRRTKFYAFLVSRPWNSTKQFSLRFY